MPDLGDLTHEQFDSCVSQPFQVGTEDADPVILELVQVEKKSVYDSDIHKRQAFSLIFRGPMEPVLAQMTYPLRHETFDELALFLVPIGPDKEGMCYEAVFT